MKKVPAPSGKYSVIEMALCGQDLHPQEKETARAFLISCRIPERSLVCSGYKHAFSLSCYTRSVKKVKKVFEKYKNLKHRCFALKTRTLKRCDWFDKWKREYHVRPLGEKFTIVPVWERRKFKPGRRIPIYLEPGSAFGSGYHETTRLMVRFLESLGGKIGSFLDIGTGTGILSVVSSKLGAWKITGFDNDRPSALAAEKNFRLNCCEGGKFFCAQLKTSKVSEHFDVVGANLLSKTLLEWRKQIMAHVRPGGYLLVSGIAIQNFRAFRREFAGVGFRCLKVLRGRRWVAILYKKRPI